MTQVKIKEGESFDGAFYRFKKQVERAGILSELKKREFYEKPCIKKKKKSAQARKRLIKSLSRMKYA